MASQSGTKILGYIMVGMVVAWYITSSNRKCGRTPTIDGQQDVMDWDMDRIPVANANTYDIAVTPRAAKRLPTLFGDMCQRLYDHAVIKADTLHGEFRMMGHVLKRLHGTPAVCGGTFVELGANDGHNSHSKFLEAELGWRGVCIEAAPHNFAKLNKSRPLCNNVNAVVWHRSEEVTFRACTGKLFGHSGLVMTRTKEEWKALMQQHKDHAECKDHVVAAEPPANLLQAYPDIDWFFLDVEGAEMQILRNFNFNRPPLVHRWSIESNKLDRDELVAFMKSKRYACNHIDKINTFCELRQTMR